MQGLGSTVIKIAIASLILGLFLSLFNVQPREMLAKLGDWALQIFSIVAHMLEWAIDYILIGAVVIVPIWLAVLAVRFLRGRLGR